MIKKDFRDTTLMRVFKALVSFLLQPIIEFTHQLMKLVV